MDTANKLVITLTSGFRWDSNKALEIKYAIDREVNSHVDVRWDIKNWDRFSVVDDLENGRYHVLDSVQDVYIVDNLKSKSDAQRLAYTLNNTFNDTEALERG